MQQHHKRHSFAVILAALLEEKGLSAREAARIAGTAPSTLASWLRGHAPTDFHAVQRLAHHLGTSLSFLLTGTHELHHNIPPSIAEVFGSRGVLFNGYLKVRIEHIAPHAFSTEGGPVHDPASPSKKNPRR